MEEVDEEKDDSEGNGEGDQVKGDNDASKANSVKNDDESIDEQDSTKNKEALDGKVQNEKPEGSDKDKHCMKKENESAKKSRYQNFAI